MGIWGFFFWDANFGADRTYTVDIVRVNSEAKEQVTERKFALAEMSDKERIEVGIAHQLGTEASLGTMNGRRLTAKILDHEFEGQITRYKTMPVLWIFLGGAIAVLLGSLVTSPPPDSVVERFFPEKP